MRVTAAQALARTQAALGRMPQDALEAATVLESGGGISGVHSLELGQRAIRVGRGTPRPDEITPVDESDWEQAGLASVLLVVASVLWAGVLARATGEPAQDGVLIGLPLGLGAAAYVDRRYLAGPDGPGRLRAHLAHALITVAVPSAVVWLLAPSGGVAVGLIVLLSCTTVAPRFGASAPCIAILVAGAGAMPLGADATIIAPLALVVMVATLGTAVWREPAVDHPPASPGVAVGRGLAGVGFGLLASPLVIASTSGDTPALAVVLPSAAASAVSAVRLSRLWDVIPLRLQALSIGRRPDRAVTSSHLRVIGSSAATGVVILAALSGTVLWLLPSTRSPAGLAMLGAMAGIAALGFTSAVLQGMGAEVAAAAGLFLAGVAALVLVPTVDSAVLAVALSILMVHVLWVPTLLRVLVHPERVLAMKL